MKKVIPYLFFILIWIAFSNQFLFFGKNPAPLDLLVNFYTPWDKYYDFAVKNPAITDIVNQIIPWKTHTAWSWGQGVVPLWNDYNLAGTPHASNWQSAVFYPTNVLFVVLPFLTAWGFHILLQPLLAGLFTILYLRSIGRSSIASLIGSLAFAYGGFLTVWLEWGTLGHALLWLPLVLFSIERYIKTKRNRFLALQTLSLAMSLLAGHIQISMYVFATTGAYWLYRAHSVIARSSESAEGRRGNLMQKTDRHGLRKGLAMTIRKALFLIALCVIPFLITAFQVLPAVEVFAKSYKISSEDSGWFKSFRIPLYGLLTFIAPDFFGNPVTGNHWSDHSYIEMMGFSGIVPLAAALLCISYWKQWKNKSLEKFFFLATVISFIFSLATPIADLLLFLKIPVLSSSSPARIIGIICFSITVLAANGIDILRNEIWKEQKRFLLICLSLTAILLMSCGLVTVFKNPNASVAIRNSFISLGILVATMIFVTFLRFFKTMSGVGLLFTIYCLLFTGIDLFRFSNKFTPFSEAKYFYPTVPVIEFLQKNPARTFGLFDANLNLPFLIPSVEGYDPAVLADYIRYTASAETGIAQLPNRASGVSFPKNGKETIKFLNELGVKYVVQPTLHGAAPWELHLWEYPNQFTLIYEDEMYQVFENGDVQQAKEPYANIHKNQEKLFVIGCSISLMTIFSTLLLVSRRKQYG